MTPTNVHMCNVTVLQHPIKTVYILYIINVSMAESKDLSFNIVVITGEPATGKSVFIHRFATSTYKLLGHTIGMVYDV